MGSSYPLGKDLRKRVRKREKKRREIFICNFQKSALLLTSIHCQQTKGFSLVVILLPVLPSFFPFN
jgi:hypothetical protein